MATLEEKHQALRRDLTAMGSVLVAFSGGVDSSLLLAVAADTLGDRCTALTTVSSAVPEKDRLTAARLATELGVRHLVIQTSELMSPDYARNPVNRCFFCKDNLFRICSEEAERRGIQCVVDGANVDDLSDHRPGLKAAEIAGARHPLIDAGLTKKDIRELSRGFNLETWDRPASPCLASRIPYGTPITEERLAQVAAGERVLHDLGFGELRLRHHDRIARLEVSLEEVPRLLEPGVRAEVVKQLRHLGFAHVTVDLAGFRSGSLNEGLGEETATHPELAPRNTSA